MAFGQIDPARLEGDALRRWYLRSPDEIEEERRKKTEQSYNAFYNGLEGLREPELGSEYADTNTTEPPQQHRSAGYRIAANTASPPPAAQGQFPKPQARPKVCDTCHDVLPPLWPNPWLPPPIGTFPVPPGVLPSFRRGSSGGASSPDGGKKECEIQERRDRAICARQPEQLDKALCYESAFKRRAYCDRRDGTIGHPALDTRKRLQGEPPLRKSR
jgi:hypothetical protein